MMRTHLKTILITIALFGYASVSFACEVCKANQPKMLENITHGQGPQGNVDYLITWSAAVLVVFTLIFSIKYLVKPKEDTPGHIKNIVLE
ncbi:hypothetical protein [Rhodonellum sp.]|uniref:hypothetical protein n=1 Tax=Rhodonellum sp. TaxID=2231180 RepID=UPI002722322C|nr:hypothetical protein [Rhodonellum sp.]MDO9551054.1 hypothetical protein [Rhodonellum sp.]